MLNQRDVALTTVPHAGHRCHRLNVFPLLWMSLEVDEDVSVLVFLTFEVPSTRSDLFELDVVLDRHGESVVDVLEDAVWLQPSDFCDIRPVFNNRHELFVLVPNLANAFEDVDVTLLLPLVEAVEVDLEPVDPRVRSGSEKLPKIWLGPTPLQTKR